MVYTQFHLIDHLQLFNVILLDSLLIGVNLLLHKVNSLPLVLNLLISKVHLGLHPLLLDLDLGDVGVVLAHFFAAKLLYLGDHTLQSVHLAEFYFELVGGVQGLVDFCTQRINLLLRRRLHNHALFNFEILARSLIIRDRHDTALFAQTALHIYYLIFSIDFEKC